VNFDDWLLSFHVLAGFSLIAALILFWVLIVAVRRTDLPEATLRMSPIARVGNVAVIIGSLGTIVFGVWLAFTYGDYDIWDGWIVAAILLWVIATAAGQRTGAEYLRGTRKAEELAAANQMGPSQELLALNRTQRGVLLHTVTSAAALVILIDMIWKPGA
jgi:uncharacterized membrane protein